jgi:D-arabinose 1-dehydrogenase-like Zn-dependent alcohol dehydrogenase
MSDKLVDYKRADAPVPGQSLFWPLYGAGFENLGQDGKPIQAPIRRPGARELLVRHDAVGLCFSDIKVIRAGQSHPRIYRDMRSRPVVLGHEVSMTVMEVGEELRELYQPGDRFIIQADIYVGGVNYAYGYEIEGGLSQYAIIDERVLKGDDGNYLLPVQPTTGYAESALTEPWACVIATYSLHYRTGLKPGGTTWVIGTAVSQGKAYTLSAGLEEASHPARLLLTNVPTGLAGWLRERAQALGVEVLEAPDPAAPSIELVDDIILLGPDPDLLEIASPRLATFGILALVADQPLPRKVKIDIGRIHYDSWVYVGGKGPDIAQAYSAVPVRSSLKGGGRAWFVGAGGPMGRMHVQRAIQLADCPATIVCSDVSDLRLDDLCVSFADEARARGIEFICLNPMRREEYAAGLEAFRTTGFDDIIVLAPIAPVIAEASEYLAPRGVMNVFAGLARGSFASVDLSQAYLKDTRIIGHTASTIEDLRLMLHQAESGELSPNRSVAAIGSLSAARDGLHSVADTTFPGKVVIYPNIKEFPLTSLPDLKDRLPSVYARLKDGREWTVEAEAEFLRLMLP